MGIDMEESEVNQEGIFLKNIDLTGWNGLRQCGKIHEELDEFEEATANHIIVNTQESKAHAIEEYLDVVQSALGLLAIAGISAQEVMNQYSKHLEKLKNRPREKKCSKCINCELIEYTNIDDVLFCNRGQFTTQEYIAKSCKCYEE